MTTSPTECSYQSSERSIRCALNSDWKLAKDLQVNDVVLNLELEERVIEDVEVHKLLSVIVTLYVPAIKEDKSSVVAANVPGPVHAAV